MPKRSRAVENRMDEFALLLAGPDDVVVLKAAPDGAYLEYLEHLRLALPRVLVPRTQDPDVTVTQDALNDPGLRHALERAGQEGAYLWPHGVSELEERLATAARLPLAAAPASVCKAVNSKVYSRRLADELGLRQPRGFACRTVDEFTAAAGAVRAWLSGGRPVAVKDAYGVSGKGIVVLRDEQRLDQVHRMIVRRAARTGQDRVAVVVEEWVAKTADLNYQFAVGRDGTVEFDFVREAITENGVHKGHRLPARLTPARVAELESATRSLGARLAVDGYFGLVGVDALLGEDGRLFPVIEINARNNMSTYQESLRERFIGADTTALALQYDVRLRRPLPFGVLQRLLGGLLLGPAGGTGLLVNNFATVNANANPAAPDRPAGTPFDGRLYGIVVADSDERAVAVDGEIRSRLVALRNGGGDA